jgi:nitroreductase
MRFWTYIRGGRIKRNLFGDLYVNRNFLSPRSTRYKREEISSSITLIRSGKMNVFDAIKQRRSIRSYQDKHIEEDKLLRVLEAGRLAPSAKNLQEWRYVIVKDKDLRKKVAVAANNQYFIAEAPVIIVGCATMADYVLTCGQPAHSIDLAISMDHMTLQAVEEGLGTCWIGAFKEDEVKKVLNIPPEMRVVEIMPLGYPKFIPDPKPRKKLEEIVFHDKYQ